MSSAGRIVRMGGQLGWGWQAPSSWDLLGLGCPWHDEAMTTDVQGQTQRLTTIAPGAFARAIGRRQTKALINHGDLYRNRSLAAQTDGSLELLEGERGLHVRVRVTDARLAEQLADWDRRGLLTGWSIGWQGATTNADGHVTNIGSLLEISLMVSEPPAWKKTSAFWCGTCVDCGEDISVGSFQAEYYERRGYYPLPDNRCATCRRGEGPPPWSPFAQSRQDALAEMDAEIRARRLQ
jgi:HK97 family phage prohead protease